MDSLDWSKKFEVLSISRLYLSAHGLPTEQINLLSDEDMERIADVLQNRIVLHDFSEDAVFVAKLVLVEQEQHDHETLNGGT